MSTTNAGTAGLGVTLVTDEKYEYHGGEAFAKTIYWHMKQNSICVSAGQKVVAGQKIGEAGIVKPIQNLQGFWKVVGFVMGGFAILAAGSGGAIYLYIKIKNLF